MNKPEKIVHPLFDKKEEKKDPKDLGPLRMTPIVRISLIALRVYLILMILLAFFRVLQLAGIFK